MLKSMLHKLTLFKNKSYQPCSGFGRFMKFTYAARADDQVNLYLMIFPISRRVNSCFKEIYVRIPKFFNYQRRTFQDKLMTSILLIPQIIKICKLIPVKKNCK